MQYQLNAPEFVGRSKGGHMGSDRFKEPSGNDARAISKAVRLIDAFRTVDPKIPSSYIRMFLAVAEKPGRGPTEYARMLETVQPVASRILLEIGPKARERDAGLGLVTMDYAPDNLKQKQYYLTDKGRLLLRQVFDILEAA